MNLETADNIFNFLSEDPSDDPQFRYFTEAELSSVGEKISSKGVTSASFAILSSYFGADSVACLESSRLDDIEKLALLRFKAVPESYGFYKRFKGDGIKGVLVGFKLRNKNILEVLYEIDHRFVIKVTASSSESDLSSNELYEGLLGRK